MSRSRLSVWVAVLVFAVLFFMLILSSETQSFVFSKPVGVGEFVSQGEGIYVANITDGSTTIKKVYMSVGAASSNSGNLREHQISIQIPYDQAELDSVAFRFSSDPHAIFAFYSKASTYVWTEVSPHEEDKGYVYKVNDLGIYGKYTVNFEFIAVIMENTNHLTIEADLSMHQPALIQLTSLTSHVFLNAKIPTDLPDNK